MTTESRTWHTQNFRWLFLAIIVFLVDQGTKWLARKTLMYYVPVVVFPWLNWQLAYNRGAAYSLLSNQASWAQASLVIIAILVIGYLLIWLFQTESYKKALLLALSLILGGAASNVFDRMVYGHVTDFIDFHLRTWHFATFNIADAAISIGAVLLALLLLLRRE